MDVCSPKYGNNRFDLSPHVAMMLRTAVNCWFQHVKKMSRLAGLDQHVCICLLMISNNVAFTHWSVELCFGSSPASIKAKTSFFRIVHRFHSHLCTGSKILFPYPLTRQWPNTINKCEDSKMIDRVNILSPDPGKQNLVFSMVLPKILAHTSMLIHIHMYTCIITMYTYLQIWLAKIYILNIMHTLVI